MLQQLVISNYAIIDRLTLSPHPGLNTLTGETGAGKSIILGALSLILGERADTSVLINKEEKSVIEGHFDVSGNDAFRRAVDEAGLDFEPVCIIRREIAVSGKSRAFINDTPVTLPVLNELTSLLVDLQQQFGHLALEEDDFVVNAIDAIAGTQSVASAYRQAYTKYKATQRILAEKKARQAQAQQEADYKQYLFDELAQADFRENEIEDAEQHLKQMAHAERILGVLNGAREAIAGGEQPMVNELKRISQHLGSIAELVTGVADLQSRLSSVHAELKDIADELESLSDKVNLDPARMDELQQRVDLGNRLLKKHGVTDTGGLLAIREKLEGELQAATGLDNDIDNLAKELAALYSAVLTDAEKLSAARKKATSGFIKRVNERLTLVGMPNALFDVSMGRVEVGPHGIDNISFLLDANKSGKFQLLHKAASGGEMSRIMLCIKSLVADALELPTLIFDEVDTGISGEAARQVGLLLRELAKHRQVIVITHQPQVAARGSRHFYVYKEAETGGRLSTRVRVLDSDERVLAIARMIGGEVPSDAAISSARELVEA
ncbi:MAG: DNA repair protein RecN [Taibaiella sp.]|nr:DNA repair protein RecN [Taibaiella sp.]